MSENQEIEIFYPTSRQHWRLWLQEHHSIKTSIWILFYKKKTNLPTLTWSEAVDEAICFGWIDSTKKTIDTESYRQFFSPRKVDSGWSKINKAKVLQLENDNLITQAGYKSIEVAKKNGSWNLLDSIEELVIPPDLESALLLKPIAKDFFESLNKSTKKSILQWLVLAKKPETRIKRITEIVDSLALRLKPKQFT